MRRPGFALGLGVVAVAAVAIRVAFVAAVAEPLPRVGDAMAYHLLADGLASGDGYVRPFDTPGLPTAEYPPGHPALLAVADLAGIDTAWGQRFLGAVLGGLSVVLTGVAGRLVRGTACGLVAAAIVGAHPLAIGHDTTLLTEGLAVAIGAAVVCTAMWLRRSRSIRVALALGSVLGAATLVRGEALVLVALLAVPLAIAWCRPSWKGAAAVVAGCAAVVLPWTARNAVRLDAFVPVSTNASTAVAGANCNRAYDGALAGYWVFGDGCFEGYTPRELARDGEAAVAARHRAEGVSYATAHAGEWPRVVGARVARVWGFRSLDQQAFLAAAEGKSPGAERAGTVYGWALVPLAALGLAAVARRGRGGGWAVAWVLGAPLVAVTLTAAVMYGHPRFRAGAEPAIAVLAAAAITSAAARR